MTRLYILRLFTLCWAVAGMATADNATANLVQELAFALMGARLERARPGADTEVTFELLDLLAA